MRCRKEYVEYVCVISRSIYIAHRMDQAASIFGLSGCVLHVSFVPQLFAEPIQLPSSHSPHVFVIANTLVTSDKKVNGPVQYNLRVGELWMACRAICKKLEMAQDDTTKVLKDLLEIYFEKNPLQRGSEEDDVEKAWQELGEEAAKIVKMEKVALPCLPNHPVSRVEAEEATGYKGTAFDEEFLSVFPSECKKIISPVSVSKFSIMKSSKQ